MKNMKRIKALLLALTMLLSIVGLSACGGNAVYQVKVLDGQGQICTSGVIVKFLQDGKQIAMQPVNGEGIAQKELPKGNYTIELTFTSDKLSGHYEPVTLTSSKTSAEVTLMSGVSSEGVTLFVTSSSGESKEYTAYNVTAGSTYIPVKANNRNYFLFTPDKAGTYKFSVDNADLTIGYYGAPHFVQSQSAAELTDGAFTLSISESMIGTAESGTSSYVIGVDGGAEDGNCVLSIIRTGDPAWNVSDEPWTEYKTSHTPTPFTLKLGAGESLSYVDITGKTEGKDVVFNEADGFYHFGTADGPVVYVHLAKGAPHVALQVVIEGDGALGGAPIREYFFDENEKFIKKEDYTEILRTYFANMDKDLGIYPLTEDLVYIIKNGCHGWWTESDPDFIFEGSNPEIAWMFALCYVAKG